MNLITGFTLESWTHSVLRSVPQYIILDKSQSMIDFYGKVDLFLFTANSTVIDGNLVMGAGMALEVKQHFAKYNLPAILGEEILSRYSEPYPTYGLIISDKYPKSSLGLFQTKRNFTEKSSIDLVRFSCTCLLQFCLMNPTAKVALNFPAIGAGGLDKQFVWEQAVCMLPNNVTIYERRK